MTKIQCKLKAYLLIYTNLLLQFLQGVLDVENGLEDWRLQNRDQSVQVIVYLGVRNYFQENTTGKSDKIQSIGYL